MRKRQNFHCFTGNERESHSENLIITFTQKGNKRTKKQKSLLNLNYSSYYTWTWLNTIQFRQTCMIEKRQMKSKACWF